MYKKLVLIILSFFLIFLLLFPGCQPETTPDFTGGTISGQAALPGNSSKDITGYTPIPGATVTVIDSEGNTHTTLTDANGFYSFDNIAVKANTIINITKDTEGGEKIVFMEVIPHTLSPEENFYAGIADAESTALALVIEALINLGQPQEEIDLEEIISVPGFASLEEAVRQAQSNNQNILTLSSIITQAEAIADYIINPPSPTPAPTPVPTPTQINIAAISGVTVPETGAIPITTITETAQYTGTVTWAPTDDPFAGKTVYTATITLTAKPGFTLTGVAENFFTVAGATATNPINSGVVTAVFPETAAVINIAAIPGVTVPVVGATPVTSITETAQYTGTIIWNPTDNPFLGGISYTATITLTPKSGFTLIGVAKNFFTVAGAVATNPIDSGIVTARFLVIGAYYGGGKVAYILKSGDPGYEENKQHGLIAATADQSTGIQWYNGSDVETGAIGTLLGFGEANTAAIVAIQGAGGYAAKVCDDYSVTVDGVIYDDWFLPSKDELNKLYINKVAIGGFADYYYWSSSEDSVDGAWAHYFSDGGQYRIYKFSDLLVRAVRAF
jgi:pyruvoyl-dependent arginine decarboxylase (PvlArgDC)